MLGLAGSAPILRYKHRLAYSRPMLWFHAFLRFRCPSLPALRLSSPLKSRRQPWVVYGVPAHADAMTPRS